MPKRLLVLADGEHYPSVIRAALGALGAAGDEVAGVAFLGGTEKVPEGGIELGVPVVGGSTPAEALEEALAVFRPDEVVDLSDEPVVDYRTRLELASRSLAKGVPYSGTDFRIDPPPRPLLGELPAIAVIGTGKRTGKTAVSIRLARDLAGEGRCPIIVAMGRGGPEEPEVIAAHEAPPDVDTLIEWATEGRHAASDYIEDALLAGVTTVGARRCGGGLAGAPGPGTFAAAVEIANRQAVREGATHLIYEGSGSAIPPAEAQATLLVVPATVAAAELEGYLGPYRLLLADAVTITMCDESPGGAASLIAAVRRLAPEAPICRTLFRPIPLEPIAGMRVVLATTAPAEAGPGLAGHLTRVCGAEVTGIAHSLSNRARLEKDLKALLPKADALLTEVKAAGIDVAARMARNEGLPVIFVDNCPEPLPGEPPLSEIARFLVSLAEERFS